MPTSSRVTIIPGGDLRSEEMVAECYGVTSDFLWHWVGTGPNSLPPPSLTDGKLYWRSGVLKAWGGLPQHKRH